MPREADMAKKIAVFLDEMVDEQEFIYPYYRLKEAGFESVSVATEKRIYKGKYGVPFTPDMLIADVTPGEFEGVVVPCLLYTSPSPRDGLLSRMPSSA